MGELAFVGLGLYSERGISLHGIEEARSSSVAFAEFYTSLMPDLNLSKLEELIGKRITVISRSDLEEKAGKNILKAAERGKAVLMVPGDPLIATTHVDLRIRAERQGIKTRIVHGASVVSAVIGLTGLQNYKYGRSVTIPFSDQGLFSETPYNVIRANKKLGLHTLCYLDIKAEEKKYMSVKEGLETLLSVEKQRRQRVITSETMVVGIARAGSTVPITKADYAIELLKYNFGDPPHSLVFPGKLHFMEAEALITLAKAPERIREMIK